MNKFRFLSLMLIALLLGACGGGSGDPTLGIGDGSGGGGCSAGRKSGCVRRMNTARDVVNGMCIFIVTVATLAVGSFIILCFASVWL